MEIEALVLYTKQAENATHGRKKKHKKIQNKTEKHLNYTRQNYPIYCLITDTANYPKLLSIYFFNYSISINLLFTKILSLYYTNYQLLALNYQFNLIQSQSHQHKVRRNEDIKSLKLYISIIYYLLKLSNYLSKLFPTYYQLSAISLNPYNLERNCNKTHAITRRKKLFYTP